MGRRELLKSTLAGGISLVVLLMLLQGITAVVASSAALTVSPSSGFPGYTAQVTGESFAPLFEVSLCWDRSGCSDLGTAQPEGVGSSFSVPINVPWAASVGAHEIFACQVGPFVCSSHSFTVRDLMATGGSSTPTTTLAETTTTIGTTTPSTVVTSTTTTTSPPITTTTSVTTTTAGDSDVLAATEEGGWSLQTPWGFWAAWLVAVVVAAIGGGLLLYLGRRLTERRR